MRTLLAQLAAKVWEALKPPQPEYGYFMPDDQSEAIRSWCKDVAASVLLDPNARDPSEPPRVRDKRKPKLSKPHSQERSTTDDRTGGKGVVCTR